MVRLRSPKVLNNDVEGNEGGSRIEEVSPGFLMVPQGFRSHITLKRDERRNTGVRILAQHQNSMGQEVEL